MPDINTLFPSSFLKASDIPQGQSVGFTIESFSMEEMGDYKSLKPMLTMVGGKKLTVNKTNAAVLQHNLGSSNTDDWIGHQIHLHQELVQFRGSMVPALRVTQNAQTIQQAPAVEVVQEAPADDNIPY